MWHFASPPLSSDGGRSTRAGRLVRLRDVLANGVIRTRTSSALLLAIGALTLAIFVADLFATLGIAVWVLYLCPVVLSNFGWRPSLPIVTSMVCSIFVVAAYFLSSEQEMIAAADFSPINRTFGILTLWAVATLGRHFIVNRRAIQLETWFKNAESGIAARLLGEQSLAQLGEVIVSFVAEYTRAAVGAAYFIDGAGSFRRQGSYALDPASVRESSFRTGDGLVGQVARDNRQLLITDVPENYLDVRSGLGRHAPTELLLVPATVDGRVLGVIEMGYLKPVTPEIKELFSRISWLLGSAIRTVNYGLRQRELLEETQRQAEELQAQQEELRVQNEELEQQSRTLQLSQTQLEGQQTELEQINTQLEEQTQSLERQRDDLARAQTELLRASTYKSEFLANMSHELRTPLNSSLILAKLLLDNREGNLTDEQVKFAQTIYSAGNDLLTLINDILDLSKIEAGMMDVRPETMSTARLVDDLLTTFSPIAQDKKLTLAAQVDQAVPEVIFTDATRLSQIIKNLMSNALKFTEIGGVTLKVKGVSLERIEFAVTDTGIGIPLEQQEVIFEAFRQADGTANRKYGGTGLGLSISRDLAELLGGELIVESAPGRGSTFRLILPVRYAGAASAESGARFASARHMPGRDAPSGGHPGDEASKQHPSQSSETPAADPTAVILDDRARIAPGARVILVIEDDLAFAQIVQEIAHEFDFQTVIAQTGAEGLALAERYRPSAVLLDVGLPDRSGLSVLDAFKHSPSTRHIPVHMMSASDHTQPALEMGAAGYALKPIQREQLLEAFKRLESKFSRTLRRILVVEDDEAHLESTCRLLTAENVETVPATTAAEALHHLSATTFDCMVMDLSLPDRSGFELLEEMSRKEQYSVPPVIVYTGRSLSRDEEQRLRRFSSTIIIKGARSPERLLDEVTLFLHQVEADLPPDRQRMLRAARNREAVFEERRVLVVEDDVRNIFAITSVLEPKGAKIEIARNGLEALEYLKKDPSIDLVLMDIMMPEMDGLEATRAIRQHPGLSRVPIIALTAKAMADDRENCLAAGANDYIAKPLDVDRLLSLARVWIRK